MIFSTHTVYLIYGLSTHKKSLKSSIYSGDQRIQEVFHISISGGQEGSVFYGKFAVQARGENKIDLVYGVYTGNHKFEHHLSAESYNELSGIYLKMKAIEELERSIERYF